HPADLARDGAFMAVDLDAAKAPAPDCRLDDLTDAAGVRIRVDGGKTDEAARVAGDDPGQGWIRPGVVLAESGKDDRPLDSGDPSSAQVSAEWRFGIPGRLQSFAFTAMAMAVDDHRPRPSGSQRGGRPF